MLSRKFKRLKGIWYASAAGFASERSSRSYVNLPELLMFLVPSTLMQAPTQTQALILRSMVSVLH